MDGYDSSCDLNFPVARRVEGTAGKPSEFLNGNTAVAGNGEIWARKACSKRSPSRASRFPMSTMLLTSATRAHTADRYPDNPLSRFAIYNVHAVRPEDARRGTK